MKEITVRRDDDDDEMDWIEIHNSSMSINYFDGISGSYDDAGDADAIRCLFYWFYYYIFTYFYFYYR